MIRFIRVSKKLEIREGCEIQDFPFKFFCFRVPKKFLGETCAVLRKISGTDKFIEKRERGENIKIFRRRFLSHCAENLWRGILFASIVSGIEKLYASEG